MNKPWAANFFCCFGKKCSTCIGCFLMCDIMHAMMSTHSLRLQEWRCYGWVRPHEGLEWREVMITWEVCGTNLLVEEVVNVHHIWSKSFQKLSCNFPQEFYSSHAWNSVHHPKLRKADKRLMVQFPLVMYKIAPQNWALYFRWAIFNHGQMDKTSSPVRLSSSANSLWGLWSIRCLHWGRDYGLCWSRGPKTSLVGECDLGRKANIQQYWFQDELHEMTGLWTIRLEWWVHPLWFSKRIAIFWTSKLLTIAWARVDCMDKNISP